MAATEQNMYQFDEIAKHNQREDCWLIINGKVYDVTPFMDDHPGGDDVMISSTGKDATTDFEDVGHSKNARDMLVKYYTGEADTSTFQATHVQTSAPKAIKQDNSPSLMIRALQLLMPVMILGLAVVIHYFTRVE